MKQVNEQPKEGQYIATWEYNGAAFCDTYKWAGKRLKVYNSDSNTWEVKADKDGDSKRTYFVAD